MPSFFGNWYPNRWEQGIGVRAIFKANGIVELDGSTGKMLLDVAAICNEYSQQSLSLLVKCSSHVNIGLQ